ncbi:hypothetical protein CAPTEDRAFT_214035 [Capitella teleta]|uniref:CUB domain-containing protein n=1 Tax=Capitella teleta TaxID=283909 RepID=R7TKN2_CAPTE|nr:hypothetical protein CAPTEDRAFT_214035 [Capitella teleta]|eukprot:ELT94062.1 hypothetical protein CAPTEDRAFT_214035 [Capitella teleta]
MMIRSFLLLSSYIAAAFSVRTFQFTQTPADVYGRVGDSAVMVWKFEGEKEGEFKITLKILDNAFQCGQQTSIDFDETIPIEVLVESISGAPMEVKAFQKCGEGQENQIGTVCTKGSGVCRFETSAGCDGFTEGLVTIRATVKHPSFDEAKEETCSYTVQDQQSETSGPPESTVVPSSVPSSTPKTWSNLFLIPITLILLVL